MPSQIQSLLTIHDHYTPHTAYPYHNFWRCSEVPVTDMCTAARVLRSCNTTQNAQNWKWYSAPTTRVDMPQICYVDIEVFAIALLLMLFWEVLVSAVWKWKDDVRPLFGASALTLTFGWQKNTWMIKTQFH